jgi:hypothetical protein
MRLRFFGLVVLAAAAMGGCASPDSTDSAGAPPSVAVSSAGSSASSSSPAGSSASSGAPVPSASIAGVPMTITGEIKDGVEPGCVLLNTSDKSYLLIGGDRSALVSGKRLTVVGTVETGVMSTCQQGIPFRVTSIQG